MHYDMLSQGAGYFDLTIVLRRTGNTKGVEKRSHIPSSMTVKLTEKIMLLRKIFGTLSLSEKQPTTLVRNYEREVSEDKRRKKIKC
jgi:hypothetical protein